MLRLLDPSDGTQGQRLADLHQLLDLLSRRRLVDLQQEGFTSVTLRTPTTPRDGLVLTAQQTAIPRDAQSWATPTCSCTQTVSSLLADSDEESVESASAHKLMSVAVRGVTESPLVSRTPTEVNR